MNEPLALLSEDPHETLVFQLPDPKDLPLGFRLAVDYSWPFTVPGLDQARFPVDAGRHWFVVDYKEDKIINPNKHKIWRLASRTD